MGFYEIEPEDISQLSDGDLRELIARLCQAELVDQNIPRTRVHWGGAQEAADGGLDVYVDCGTSLSPTDFLSRENIGIQVKKNKMLPSMCEKEMLDNNELKETIFDLVTAGGQYVIASGADSCSYGMMRDRLKKMGEVLKSCGVNHYCVDFWDRDRLCDWVRCSPAVSLWVRSKLGKPFTGWLSFDRWRECGDFFQDHSQCIQRAGGVVQEEITIAQAIREIREKLRSPGGVVRLTGLSGVGKTRFSQALFECDIEGGPLHPENTVYADLGRKLVPSELPPIL